MIKIEFQESEIAQLRYERYHHPHPRVQQKMEALLLKSEGMPHKDIARITGICPNTLRSYLKDYQTGGIEKLKEINFYQPSSELDPYRGILEEYFRNNPVATIAEAASKIEEITGIKRSPGRVSHFLKSLGMERRKVGMVPAKADPVVQEEFKKRELEPRLESARKGERAVFFMDAAHPRFHEDMLCVSPLSGIFVVIYPLFYKSSMRSSTFQRIGSDQCYNS